MFINNEIKTGENTLPNLFKLIPSSLFLILIFIMTANSASLFGSEWGNDKPVEQFIRFSDSDSVSGHAGCNQFFGAGKIEQSSGKISIGPLASTKKLCEQSVMQAEFLFLRKLENSKTLKRTAKHLEFLDNKGELLMRLVWRDFD